ncbi:SH3 domain-containing protein [Micrococcoides hystricis]|uniref:SH3 domain-containing protein n=1 Tax=Micrococcoides hystricis TaxID=1572761 RepID=A0ABV6P8A0_9MICC
MNAQRLTTILVTFSLLLIGLGATAPSATAAGQAQLTVGHISAPTALTRGARYLPTASLILRERATSKSRRLATVPRDAVVTANGREGKVYAQVRYGNRTGWVLKKYLSRVYTVNKTYHTLRSVTLYKNRTSTSARVTSVATKRNVTVLMRAGNWSQVKTGTRVGWTATKNLKLGMVPQPINAWYKTNRNSVAVKSSRSTKGTTIGTMSKAGYRIKVKTRYGSWASVDWKGRTGYVPWAYLTRTTQPKPPAPTNPGVAVYGTLRKGQSAYFLLNGKTSAEHKTKITNHVMYLRPDQRWWSFILPRTNSTGVVAEEMIIKPSLYSSTLRALDEWERFDPNKPLANQTYNRKYVTLANGRKAWSYVASSSMQNYLKNNGILVKSGDYLRRN